MAERFRNKVVLVVGGGRGIGRAIAEDFADEGATVAVSARTLKPGEETVEAIRKRGGKASLVRGDISDRAAVKAMIEQTVKAHGGLDIVVHSASDNSKGLIAEMPDETYDYLVRCNIHSLFWVAKDAAPHLSKAKDKGRLIYISSGAANRTFVPGLIPYGSSKAFMNAFARGLAVEFGARNILVNVVEPGLTASDRMKEDLTDDQAAAIARNFPVPRPGEPKEVASAVLYLASPEASYITGAALLVDGGASMVSLGDLETYLKH